MSRVYACVWVAFIRSWWFNVYFCHESDNNFCLTYLLWFRSSAWGQGHVEKPLANGDFAEQGARAPRVGVAMTNECQRPMSNVCRHTASRSCHHRHILIAHCRHQHEQSKKVERIPTEWRRNPNSSSIRKKKQNKTPTKRIENALWIIRMWAQFVKLSTLLRIVGLTVASCFANAFQCRSNSSPRRIVHLFENTCFSIPAIGSDGFSAWTFVVQFLHCFHSIYRCIYTEWNCGCRRMRASVMGLARRDIVWMLKAQLIPLWLIYRINANRIHRLFTFLCHIIDYGGIFGGTIRTRAHPVSANIEQTQNKRRKAKKKHLVFARARRFIIAHFGHSCATYFRLHIRNGFILVDYVCQRLLHQFVCAACAACVACIASFLFRSRSPKINQVFLLIYSHPLSARLWLFINRLLRLFFCSFFFGILFCAFFVTVASGSSVWCGQFLCGHGFVMAPASRKWCYFYLFKFLVFAPLIAKWYQYTSSDVFILHIDSQWFRSKRCGDLVRFLFLRPMIPWPSPIALTMVSFGHSGRGVRYSHSVN